MIECPFCYRVFRQPPEKLGARCPKCKMPFYEDPAKRRRPPEQDFGPCAQHPESASIARCSRCNSPVCQACRTQWHEETVCPQCVDISVADDEPGPQEAQLQTKEAWFSVILAAASWTFLLMTIAPLSTFHQGTVQPIIRSMTYAFFFGSMIPAAFGLGFGFAAVRLRGSAGIIAMAGLASSCALLGLTIGIVVLNLWHN